MNRRDKQYKKIAEKKAKEYLRLKRGYKSPQEKKAFKIAEKLRIQAWKDSLSTMDAAEKEAQLRAFRAYRGRIYLKLRLVALGVMAAAAVAAALIIFL